MLNTISLMGRVASAPELRSTQSGVSVTTWTLAVDRDFQSGGTNRECDFISCVAWNKTAEFIAKYFGKGRMIAITGTLHSRTYDDKNGTKHYVTEVYADSADFTGEPKPAQNAQNAPYSAPQAQGYNNTNVQPQAPQRAPQTAQQANPNGYPSPYMYAPPRDQAVQQTPQQAAASDMSADFAAFGTFDEQGLPF